MSDNNIIENAQDLITIDTNELSAVSGGENFGPGQGFRGVRYGAENYIGGSDVERNVRNERDMDAAGFDIIGSARSDGGQGPGLGYEARCRSNRTRCEWNNPDAIRGYQRLP